MSKGLGYYVKARPESAKLYFDFLKQNESHLDPKTRSLISVITKIAVQTEGGFRQYLPRTLRDGATANEVIDAILMAFPALGLAKITWAFDIIADMDIPEFRPENLDAVPEWHDVVDLAALPDGEISYHALDGRNLYIFREGDAIQVYDSRCPHQMTDVPHLALEGSTLTCPKHNWVFDARSGDCIKIGKRPLRKFEHKIEAGRLHAFW
jgi:nitrite reductase/ring-hydroxylating ferredoxin subunit